MEAFWSWLHEAGWTEMALAVGMRILGALLLFLVGLRIVRWIVDATGHGLVRANVEPIAVMFLRKVTSVILLMILALAALQVVGVPMTSMIAVLGAAGLAVGLALKDSLSNIASGVMLVSLKPFRVGDIVTIHGQTGKVEAISIFQTQLRGADNQTVVLPNSLITADSIINLTPDVMRRIELVIGIGYEDDIDLARGIAMDIIQADERILPEPPADVLVYGLGDSSVNLGIRCHVRNIDWFVTKCELTERIKKAFDRHGITIPFPQRDVHMYHHDGGGEGGRKALPPGPHPQQTIGLDDPQHQPAADPQ